MRKASYLTSPPSLKEEKGPTAGRLSQLEVDVNRPKYRLNRRRLKPVPERPLSS